MDALQREALWRSREALQRRRPSEGKAEKEGWAQSFRFISKSTLSLLGVTSLDCCFRFFVASFCREEPPHSRRHSG